MKFWVSVTVLALLLMYLYLQDENHSLSHPAVNPVATTQPPVNYVKAEPPAAPKRKAVTRPPRQEQVQEEEAQEETPAPEYKPDLLTWTAPTPVAKREGKEPDEYVNEIQEKVEDHSGCPVLMVTYGSNPKSNVKVENRKTGGDEKDLATCAVPTGNFVVNNNDQ
jgi:hypothetical protein